MKEPSTAPAHTMIKRYLDDKDYRKELNKKGIFITRRWFFNGEGVEKLYLGTWAEEVKRVAEEQ